jgi:threonine/homoserine/homoserine lactone efflux protein
MGLVTNLLNPKIVALRRMRTQRYLMGDVLTGLAVRIASN